MSDNDSTDDVITIPSDITIIRDIIEKVFVTSWLRFTQQQKQNKVTLELKKLATAYFTENQQRQPYYQSILNLLLIRKSLKLVFDSRPSPRRSILPSNSMLSKKNCRYSRHIQKTLYRGAVVAPRKNKQIHQKLRRNHYRRRKQQRSRLPTNKTKTQT